MPSLTPFQNENQVAVDKSIQPHNQAPSHKRRFDEKTWKQLDGYDFRILDHLMFLCKVQAKNSGTGAAYCYPSEKWLAKKLGVRRETISRHVVKLHSLGVIERIRRRKIRGRWQTNLYKVVRWVLWRLKAALGPLRAQNKPCAPRRTHSTPYRVNESLKRQKGAPSAIKGILTGMVEQLKTTGKLEVG